MILVTGFAPYDGDSVNASARLIEALRAELPDELTSMRHRLRFEIIEWRKGPPEIESESLRGCLGELLATHQPSVCLFTGQARGDSAIRVERVGLNFFMGQRIDPQGPVAYWSTLPGIESIPELLHELHIPAEHSNYAGSYLCNHILYSTLHEYGEAQGGVKAGFVHIPLTPQQTLTRHPGLAHMPTALVVQAITRILVHLADVLEFEDR